MVAKEADLLDRVEESAFEGTDPEGLAKSWGGR